jgi:hypothetical protein
LRPELVGLSPDKILASPTPAVATLRQQTRTIPTNLVASNGTRTDLGQNEPALHTSPLLARQSTDPCNNAHLRESFPKFETDGVNHAVAALPRFFVCANCVVSIFFFRGAFLGGESSSSAFLKATSASEAFPAAWRACPH